VWDLPEVRFVHGDGSVAYQVWGSAPRDLLLITDWVTSVDTIWDHPGRLRILTLQSSIARVIRFDPRGLGASDPLPLDEYGNFELWVDDALRVLDDANAPRVAVSCEGLMSHVGLRLAAEHPERVDRVAVSNGFARLTAGDGYPYGPSPESFIAGAERARRAWGTGRVLRRTVTSLEHGATDPAWFARDERLAASPGVAAAMVTAMARADLRSVLPAVHVPVLVLHTGEFRHVPVEHCRYLAEHLPNGRLVEAPSRTFYSDLGGRHTLVEFLTDAPYDVSDREVLTLLFTDVVGSTRRVDLGGDVEWRRTMDSLDAFVELEARHRDGRVVKQLGDGHLVVFRRPVDAVRSAFAFMRGASALELELRAGVHIGEVELRAGGDVAGVAVHIASRIAALAGAGEVIASRTVSELIRGAGFVARDLGEHSLRGVGDTWTLVALSEPSSSHIPTQP
jgi:class 3 adenylate cyclase/pimeloyl-ACP methyl ester carboxylesterase